MQKFSDNKSEPQKAVIPTARQPDSPTARQPDSPTFRQTDRPTDRHSDRPTDPPPTLSSRPERAAQSGETCSRLRFAFLVVIPEGNLLLPLPFLVIIPEGNPAFLTTNPAISTGARSAQRRYLQSPPLCLSRCHSQRESAVALALLVVIPEANPLLPLPLPVSPPSS